MASFASDRSCDHEEVRQDDLEDAMWQHDIDPNQDVEDEEVIEVDLDEAEKEVISQWTAPARYHLVRRFNVRGLF